MSLSKALEYKTLIDAAETLLKFCLEREICEGCLFAEGTFCLFHQFDKLNLDEIRKKAKILIEEKDVA